MKAMPGPEWRGLERPDADEAVVRRNGLGSRPQKLAQFVRQRKVNKRLGVKFALTARRFEAKNAEQAAVFTFDDLEFSDPAFQPRFGGANGLPKRHQLGQVIDGGAPDLVTGQIHRAAV